MKYILLAFTTLFLFSCTEQTRAKQFGGTAIIEVKNCHKVFDVTWKDDDLWIATVPMGLDDKPRDVTFTEDSSWGMLEGTVLIREKCDKGE